MVSLLLKSLMIVLAISCICSTVIPRAFRKRIPVQITQSIGGPTIRFSIHHHGNHCPNPGDEKINKNKKSCSKECSNYKKKDFESCMSSCIKRSKNKN